MSAETRELFYLRHEREWRDIVAEAERMVRDHQEDPDDWYPWYVAAERSLTAKRIERARLRLIDYYTEALAIARDR